MQSCSRSDLQFLSYYDHRSFAVVKRCQCNLMSIEQLDKIDSVTIDLEGMVCKLGIVDHLEWGPEHLALLQRKINYCLRFIESGEIYVLYPHAAGCEFYIELEAIFEPDAAAVAFIAHAEEVLIASGFQFSVSPLASSYADPSD